MLGGFKFKNAYSREALNFANFNWLLMIYSIFCTTKVSPKRDHQVLKIKLELEKLILDHHIVVVVVMIIGL